MPNQHITIIGGLAMDLVTVAERLPEHGETLNATSFSKHLGGKGANSAVTAHRASHPKPRDPGPQAELMERSDRKVAGVDLSEDDEIKVRMVGAVGTDEFGPPCLAKLRQTGVDASGIREIEGGQTGICVIIVEADFGENRVLLTAGANLCLLPAEFTTLESLLGPTGTKPDLLIMQLEILRETVEQILATASRHGIDVLLNPAPAQYLLSDAYLGLTHLIVNETEAALLAGKTFEEITHPAGWADVAQEFLDKGVKNVVITLGAQGAYYANAKGDIGHVEAVKNLDVVDTTGAGDTFVGTYGVEYVQQKRHGEWNIRQGVERACKASARTIGVLGAQEAIPWADEIDPPARHLPTPPQGLEVEGVRA